MELDVVEAPNSMRLHPLTSEACNEARVLDYSAVHGSVGIELVM